MPVGKIPVEVELLLLVKEAVRTAAEASKDISKQLSSIDFKSTITALNQGFEFFRNTAGRAMQEVVEEFRAAVNEASEAEGAISRLSNAMRITGDFSDQAVQNFSDLAEEIQRVTTVEDDAVLAAAALAKQFQLTNTEAAKVVKTAVDLSAVTGDDLNTSVSKLAQSFNGFVDKSLAKMIPGLKGFSEAQLQAGELVDFLAQKLGGSAAREAQRFEGVIAQTTNKFTDFQESIGDTVVKNQAVIESIKIVGDVFSQLKAEIDANQDVFKGFVTEGIKAVANFIPVVVQGFKIVDQVVSSTVIEFNNFGRSLGAIAAAAVALANRDFAAISEINRQVTEDNENAVKGNAERISQIYEPLVNAARSVADRVNAIDASSSQQQAARIKQLSDAEIRANEARIQSARRLAKEREQALKDFESIRDEVNAFGFDDLERAQKEFQRKREILEKAVTFNLFKDREEKERLLANFQVEEARRVAEIQKRINAEVASDFGAKLGEFIGGNKDVFKNVDAAAIAAGVGAGVSKGFAGAKDLVSSIGGGIADAFVPGIGGAVKQIIDALASGPEHVRKMIREFVQALPVILTNILTSIPEIILGILREIPKSIIAFIRDGVPQIIDAFIQAIPEIIQELIRYIPQFVVGLIKAIIDSVPKIVKSFIDALVSQAKEFINALIEALSDVGGLLGIGDGGSSGGGGIGDILGTIADPFDFFGIASTSDREVGAAESGGGSAPLPVQVVMDRRVIAEVMVDLNQRGYRLA